MQMTQKTHRWLGVQNALFYLLLVAALGLLGYLGHTFRVEWDWTAGNRNSLSEPTVALLRSLEQPLKFIAYVPNRPDLEENLRKVAAKYQRVKPDTSIEFVNPDLDPVRAKQDGIQFAGQLVVRIGERSEVVDNTREQTIAHAIQRLSRGGERLVVFLEGHGERDPLAEGSNGMSTLASHLQRSGFKLQPHNLIRTQSIPDNAAFVVLAAPQQDWLPGEVEVLKKYVEQGGNLLWLHEPGGLKGLQALEELLGVQVMDGTVVDANQALQLLLGINHPAVVPVVDYSNAEVVRKLRGVQTLFPFATMVGRDAQAADKADAVAWQADEFLSSLPTSWLETSGTLEGAVRFDDGSNDRAGPLPLGVLLTREVAKPSAAALTNKQGAGDAASAQQGRQEDKAATGDAATATGGQTRQQRVAVLGDSDFLLNSFVTHGANLDLALNLFNWLGQDDSLLDIPLVRAPDTKVELGETGGAWLLGGAFLAVLPLGLLLSGLGIWWYRRRR